MANKSQSVRDAAIEANKVANKIAEIFVKGGITQEVAFCAYLNSCSTMALVIGISKDELIQMISRVYDQAASVKQKNIEG